MRDYPLEISPKLSRFVLVWSILYQECFFLPVLELRVETIGVSYAKCSRIKQVIKWDFRELRAHFVLPLIPGFARKVVITLQK